MYALCQISSSANEQIAMSPSIGASAIDRTLNLVPFDRRGTVIFRLLLFLRRSTFTTSAGP